MQKLIQIQNTNKTKNENANTIPNTNININTNIDTDTNVNMNTNMNVNINSPKTTLLLGGRGGDTSIYVPSSNLFPPKKKKTEVWKYKAEVSDIYTLSL